MALWDTLSHFKPKPAPEIALGMVIHHAHLSPVQKEALQLALRWMLRCVPWLISSSLAGPMTSRKSHAHYVPIGNTISHSLLKMDLCCVEKPSSSLHQKGRRSLVLCTNHTKALPKHAVAFLWLCFQTWYQQGHWGSCLAMWNMHEISSPEWCYTTHTNTYTFMSLADMCMGHLHIGWCGLPHPCWILFQGNPGMHSLLCRPK